MKVVDQAVWLLGNIMGDCAEFRDMVANAGTIPILNRVIAATTGVSKKPELVYSYQIVHILHNFIIENITFNKHFIIL